jgi:predicted transcriptional regulator
MMKSSVDARSVLAFGITFTALVGILILAWVTIATTDAQANARAQSVLNITLPLFGTWVGTVLAYYFSRENFEAATNSTQKLYGQFSMEEKLRSIPIATVMTKNVFSITGLTTKVEDALKAMDKNKVKRLPILQSTGALDVLLFNEGIVKYLLAIKDVDRPKKTLSNLISEMPDLKQPAAFVNEKSTLADAKSTMENLTDCRVVFVTKNGNTTEPILGIVTSTDIAKHSTP